jgi:hypothetical protein
MDLENYLGLKNDKSGLIKRRSEEKINKRVRYSLERDKKLHKKQKKQKKQRSRRSSKKHIKTPKIVIKKSRKRHSLPHKRRSKLRRSPKRKH